MPWKVCSAMEERLRFVARLLDGEGVSDLCREFGISRKTGYKIYDRYKDETRLGPMLRWQRRLKGFVLPLLRNCPVLLVTRNQFSIAAAVSRELSMTWFAPR
jgi:transposase-like protein